MNWQAFGAIADIVGSIGVVVSLLYLAAQIKQSRRESRVAAGETAIRSLREVLVPIIPDPELAKLFSRLFIDPSVFDGPQRDQAFHIMFYVVKAFESVHYHRVNGILESGVWKGWSTLFLHYINTSGFHRYWALRRDVYSPAFQSWIEENATHTEGLTVGRLGDAVDGGTA